MTPWDQLLLVNPQQPCRPEAEHVPHAFGAPPARHCKGLPQRGENVLMACNSPQALIGRQQALFIIQRCGMHGHRLDQVAPKTFDQRIAVSFAAQ